MIRSRLVPSLVATLLAAGCGGEQAAPDRSTADLGVPAPSLSTGSQAPRPPAPPPGAAPSTEAPAPGPATAPDRPSPRQTLEDLGHVMGSPDAPVRVIEFSDFGCGYCRKFHEETFPAILEEFVNTGKVEWRTVQFDVGMFPNATDAAHAGECGAEQDLFAPIADGLFAEQRAWKGGGEPARVFESVAESAGLDMARFRACMAEGRFQERVQVGTQLARQLGIRGTPTFFIEGFPVQGALPIELFREYITIVLAEKAKQESAPAGGGD